FEGGQIQYLASAANNPGTGAQLEPPDNDRRGIILNSGASIHSPVYGPDPGGKFSGIERLRKIIVRTDLETQDAIEVVTARRQHQHGSARPRPNPAKNLKSVHPR